MNIEDTKTPQEILDAIKDQPLTSNATKLRVKYKNKTYTLTSVDSATRQYLLSNVEIKGDPGFWVDEKSISWSTIDLN